MRVFSTYIVSPVNVKPEQNNAVVTFSKSKKYEVIAHLPIGDTKDFPYEIKKRFFKPLGYVNVKGGFGYLRIIAESKVPIGPRFLGVVMEEIKFETQPKQWKAVSTYVKDWLPLPEKAYQLFWEARNTKGERTRLEAGGIILLAK